MTPSDHTDPQRTSEAAPARDERPVGLREPYETPAITSLGGIYGHTQQSLPP